MEALTDNVVPFHRPTRRHEPPATDDELAEYRALKPKLMQMLKEWEALKSRHGCPVAHSMFND